MRHIVAVAALLVVSACAAPLSPSAMTPSSSAMPLASGEIALPIEPPVSLPPGAVEACAGVGLSAVLHGDAADPHVAWLVNDLGTRIDVMWPPGYRARFTPNLEVLDGSEVVVIRAGDPVTGGCVTADPAVLLLEPPFR
jgi:hypothetical protein